MALVHPEAEADLALAAVLRRHVGGVVMVVEGHLGIAAAFGQQAHVGHGVGA